MGKIIFSYTGLFVHFLKYYYNNNNNKYFYYKTFWSCCCCCCCCCCCSCCWLLICFLIFWHCHACIWYLLCLSIFSVFACLLLNYRKSLKEKIQKKNNKKERKTRSNNCLYRQTMYDLLVARPFFLLLIFLIFLSSW